MADPVKLLDFYSESDHEILFGREEEKKSLARLLSVYSIIIVSGESGTGKTSLLRAGLIPVLHRDSLIVYHPMNSSSRKQLPRQLISHELQSPGEEFTLKNSVEVLEKWCKKEGKQNIIILDQFEDFLVGYQEREKWFPATMLHSITSSPYIRFLFCLRSDYLPLFMKWLHPTRLHFLAEQFFYLTRFPEQTAGEVLQHIFFHQNIHPGYNVTSHIASLLAALDVEGTVYPPHLQIIASYIIQQTREDTTPGTDFTFMTGEEVETILSGFFNKELFRDMTGPEEKIVKKVLDTLVGREGLRRKLTAGELAAKMKCHEDELTPLLDTLIQRRTLRRNQEGRFELVHDFLSRHFFESFSTEEKNIRRLQDMFTAAMMDYRDAGILLDERRIRLFLHHRDILDLDREAMIFLITSILSLFIIGSHPYLDLSMKKDLFDLLQTETNRDNRNSIISQLGILAGYNDIPYLLTLYEKETDSIIKTDILTLIAEIDPAQAKSKSREYLHCWEERDETFLEGVIRSVRYFYDPSFIPLLLPLLSAHPSDSIQLTVIETLDVLKDVSVIPDLLQFLEEKKIKIARVIDSCIMTLDNLLTAIRDKNEYDSLKSRFISLLKKLIYTSVYVSRPYVFAAYIKYAVPDPSECESLLTTTQDNNNIDSIIQAIGDLGDPAYKDTLLFFIRNTEDNIYRETAVSSLGKLKSGMDFSLYMDLYIKYPFTQIRYTILDILVNSGYPEALDLFHDIIQKEDTPDSRVLIKTVEGLSKYGDEQDILLLKNLFTDSRDLSIKEQYIEAISGFNLAYNTTVKNTLTELWKNEDEDSLRTLIACKLYLLGDTTLYPFLLTRLSQIDQHFGKYVQQSLFPFTRDPVLEIFKVFLMRIGPFPEPQATRRTLQDIVLHAGNREYACIGLVILGAFFEKELHSWFCQLTEKANRLELRGLALLAIAGKGGEETFHHIKDLLFQSNWPLLKKYALYALGIAARENKEHEQCITILTRFIQETPSSELLDFALWVYYACGTGEDGDIIEGLLSHKETLQSGNIYFTRRMEETFQGIQEKPLEDRTLPTLENLYKIENYWWRQSLKLNPLIFTY
jgi:HEAT repeat protein